MRSIVAVATAVSALALAAGCGSSSSSSSKSTSTAAASSSQPAAASTTSGGSAYGGGSTGQTAAVGGEAISVTTKHGKLGTILAAGPHRLTVYMFTSDKAGSSSCSGSCAALWPPVTTSAAPHAAAGAKTAALGTITRPDGTKQVTYQGHPLYFFARDKDDGDSYGQGIKSFGAEWYAIKPSGEKLDNS